MPYVPGVVNDVFISYAHVDNQTPFAKRGWVSHFAAHLHHELTLRIGLGSREEIRCFFDERGIHPSDHLDKLKENVRQSAAFVAIVSPSYVAREWPQQELETFAELPNSAGRIFVVESLPPETPYPAALQGLIRTEFWTQPEHSDIKRRLSPRAGLWTSKVQDVAEHIKILLRKLRQAGGIAPVTQDQPLLSIPIASNPRRTVLLAQVTD